MRDSMQGIITQPETGDVVHSRGGDQIASQIISPGVIRTLDRRCELPRPFLGQPGTSVAADVVKRVQLAPIVADEDQALAGDFEDDEIARVGDLIGASRMEPHAEKEPLELGAIMVGVGVIPSRQTHCLGGLPTHGCSSSLAMISGLRTTASIPAKIGMVTALSIKPVPGGW